MRHMCSIKDVTTIYNSNGTRTLISTKKDKPLVTYRSENQVSSISPQTRVFWQSRFFFQDYDKAATRSMGTSLFNTTSPLKSGQVLSSQNNLSDPILPTFNDVYLCDSCDRDFDSVTQLSVSKRVTPKKVLS